MRQIRSGRVPAWVKDLNRLVGGDLLGTWPTPEPVVAKWFAAMCLAAGSGRTDEFWFYRIRLAFLHTHLQRVEAKRPDVTERLRRLDRLWSPNVEHYLGARAELAVADLLLRHGCGFEFDGLRRPDFDVEAPDGGSFSIEVTSAHLNGATGDALRTLRRSVRRKSSKPYASASVGLYIDVTSAAYTTGAKEVAGYQALMKAASGLLERSRFGTLTLARGFWVPALREYGWYAETATHSRATKALVEWFKAADNLSDGGERTERIRASEVVDMP